MELKNPLVDALACATAIEVPLPITAFVPSVIVKIFDVVSVKSPNVKALCLLLNVLQSVELNLPLFVALANGIFRVKEPLDVIGLPVTLTSVPTVPVPKPTLVTVPTFEVLLLNVFQSVEDKNPLVDASACATSIEVPLPITAFVPSVIVKIFDVVSVKSPNVKALCLLLNVFQSVEDK